MQKECKFFTHAGVIIRIRGDCSRMVFKDSFQTSRIELIFSLIVS